MLERPKLGLEFSYEFEKDERTSPDIEIKNTTMTFSEGLDIETKGWVYHPALVVYKLRLSPGWKQRSEESDGGEKRTSRTFLQGYSTEFTFLQFKPYTLRIFANRNISTLKSSFAKRSEIESDTYGATLTLKYRVPTRLSYSHLKSRQTGFFTADTDRDELHLRMSYDRNLGDTRLNASYIDYTQTRNGTPVNLTQKNATLQNFYNLTEDKSITSVLNYINTQSGITETTGYNIFENLSWRHRKNLTTSYTLRYSTTHFETIRGESTMLGFNLIHLLYENLTTSVNVDGVRSQSSGQRELVYGAGLKFNYRRKIPWGMLNLNMGHNYKIREKDITANFIQVIDESISLTTGTITLLANEHVDIDSIVVTDNTGTIVYIRDMDYRITEIDFFTRISRIPDVPGGIADGQEVLVDYKYLSNPVSDYSIFGQSYGINLNLWSAWSIYYRFQHSKQKSLSGIQPDRLTDDSIHIAGTELKWRWSRTKFEFKDKETTNVPTTGWRASEIITLRPFKWVFFNFSGSYGRTKFKDTGEIETFNNLSTNIQMLTSRWSKFSLGGFRNKLSGISERTTDSGISSIFEWFYRIWSGSLRYRFTNEKDEISQETRKNHYFLFEIKRRLF